MNAPRSLCTGLALAALLTTGCSDRVCFQWSVDEGACPPREEADNYVDPTCEEPIESFDSEGELEDGACCYDVTTINGDEYCYEG